MSKIIGKALKEKICGDVNVNNNVNDNVNNNDSSVDNDSVRVISFIRIKYMPSVGCFLIVSSLGKIRINEGDFYAILEQKEKKKVWLSETEWEYGSEDLSVAELNEIVWSLDIDNDSFNDICLMHYEYCLSVSLLNEVKRKAHRYKLGKCETPYVEVVARNFESWKNRGRRGGRGTGAGLSGSGGSCGLGYIEQNVENYDAIVAVCVEKDRFAEFLELEKEYCKWKGIPFRKRAAVAKFAELRARVIALVS